MNITTTLAVRHMRRNKTRTAYTTIITAVSVCIMILISSFLGTLFDLMIRSEIARNGSWHLQFHELTESQIQSLKTMSGIKSVTVHEEAEESGNVSLYAEVEYQKITGKIYDRAQETAEKIGMKEYYTNDEPAYNRPDAVSSVYNISYHAELLQYYGALNLFSNNMLPLTSVFGSIYVLLSLLAAIFIYHAYSNSAQEQLRYMGLLGSVGATKWQKRSCIIIECISTSLAGIGIGCFFGFALSKSIFRATQHWLIDFTGSTVKPQFTYSVEMLVLTGLCTIISVLTACLIPAQRVSKLTIIDALQSRTKEREIKRSARIPKFLKKHCSAEAQMAFKNITFHKKRYLGIIAPLILTMCLFLVAYVYLAYVNGMYDLGQNRQYEENSIQIMLTNVSDKKVEEFLEKLQNEPSIEHARFFKTSMRDAAIPASYIASIKSSVPAFYYTTSLGNDYPKSYIDQNGISGDYYPFFMYFYGLDSQTYNDYLKKCNISADDYAVPPVIIEDTLIYRLGTKDFLGGSISLSGKNSFDLLLDSKEDEYFFSPDHKQITGQTISFSSAFATTQAPPLNIVHKPGRDNINMYYVYLPMEQFNSLTTSAAYQYQNEDPSRFDAVNIGINLEPKRTKKDSFLQNNSFFLASRSTIKQHAKEDSTCYKKIEEIAKTLDLTLDFSFSENSSENETYYIMSEWFSLENNIENPAFYIMQIFSYGILILITIFCISNIVSGMSASLAVRKREFPVLQSMGMTPGHIRKMLLIENSIYGLSTFFIGIPASLFSVWVFTFSLRKERGLNIYIPQMIFWIELGVILLIILFSMVGAVHQCRKINIIETIRNETI